MHPCRCAMPASDALTGDASLQSLHIAALPDPTALLDCARGSTLQLRLLDIRMSSDDIEHTLFVCRQVNLYRVPPKATAGGHKSGEWKVADKIFTGRLKVTATGDAAEIRLEDSETCVS